MKKLFPLLFLLLSLSSCRMNLLYMTVGVPAPVTISNSVKSVGVLNRSIPDEKEKILNSAHQVLSAQSYAMLKEGGAESMRGLKDALMENKRFERILVLDSFEIKNAAIGMFPSALSWDKVEQICKSQNLDALFVLEMFDTDLKVNTSVVPTSVINPVQIVNAVQNVNFTTVVKTGWRIYIPEERKVVDEFTVLQSNTSSGNGNPLVTLDAILQRKEAIKNMANDCGHIYAVRILPERIRVNRNYFIRGGSQSFAIAKRRARTGNWDGAADLWLKETNSSKRKSAGRACYNMGIINEINGNLDEAISWTQKAYEDYRVRQSLDYLRILRNRKAAANVLQMQNQE